jgi:hypothetical protein
MQNYKSCFTFSGMVDVSMEEMWQTKIPLIVENFLWLICQNKNQIADNLLKKQWKRSKNCKLCNSEETVDPLLFLYPLACFMWSVIRDGIK